MSSSKKYLPLRPEKVELGGGIGDRFHATLYHNLLRLNLNEDFLQPFQQKNLHTGYIGLGKNIDSMARFQYYHPDHLLADRLNLCLEMLKKSMLKDGYSGILLPEDRFSGLWDVHEISYLILGCVACYEYLGRREALQIAENAADCLLRNLTPEVLEKLNHIRCGEIRVYPGLATIGFERALLNLYRVSGDSRYFEAVGILGIKKWNLDIVLSRKDGIEGHAYAYLARCLAQLELYERTGTPELLLQTEKVMDFLLRKGGMVVTGACGIEECWHNDQSGAGDLGETCATAYFIRLLSRLLEQFGGGIYGDIMERVIFNVLFAAQSPDGRSIRYYSPMEGDRKYWDRDTYCCPNNYRRILAELPELIYFRSTDGILVNLYTESNLELPLEKGGLVQIIQHTEYPQNGRVRIELFPDREKTFSLSLRIPRWCSSFRLKQEGAEVKDYDLTDGILALRRSWRPGDSFTLELDMPFRTINGFCRQQGKVAVLRGPQVFCFNPRLNPDIEPGKLSTWRIDPHTMTAVACPESPFRIACRVVAFQKKEQKKLFLTPFPDPDGKAVYLASRFPELAVSDELFFLENFKLPHGMRVERKTEGNGR